MTRTTAVRRTDVWNWWSSNRLHGGNRSLAALACCLPGRPGQHTELCRVQRPASDRSFCTLPAADAAGLGDHGLSFCRQQWRGAFQRSATGVRDGVRGDARRSRRCDGRCRGASAGVAPDHPAYGGGTPRTRSRACGGQTADHSLHHESRLSCPADSHIATARAGAVDQSPSARYVSGSTAVSAAPTRLASPGAPGLSGNSARQPAADAPHCVLA